MNPVTSSISSLQGLPHKPVSAKPSVALKDVIEGPEFADSYSIADAVMQS